MTVVVRSVVTDPDSNRVLRY